jgi:hypothetical protein
MKSYALTLREDQLEVLLGAVDYMYEGLLEISEHVEENVSLEESIDRLKDVGNFLDEIRVNAGRDVIS